MLVRIGSDQGLFGYAPAPPDAKCKQAIDHLIAPFLAGRTLVDPDALRILFQQGPGADAEISRVYGAVEIALYDLAGKAANMPVSELIGGRVRDRIRLYASGGLPQSFSSFLPDDYAAEASRARALGFRAYKMQAGGGEDRDLETVGMVREANGPDLDLMVDAQAWWNMGDRNYPPEAVERLAKEMAELEIRWLEEPLPFDDHEGYAELKALEVAPLSSGRHEPNELRFLDLIESRAVDYVQMDLISQGGYGTARRLFPDIARAGLRFAFHNRGTDLDTIAAAHLGVCWPESVVRWLEYPFPAGREILKTPLAIERGELHVPRGPGLGVDIDESVIWKYPYLAA